MSEVNTHNRIFFIEPNTLENAKYEDLCISFNLSAEIIDRQGNADTTFSIQFSSNDYKRGKSNFLKGDGKLPPSSDVSGNEVGTYLTTYYTNIHSEDINEREIIEGLGVESIQISYENFYTPRVTIKFIDLHGSALFGREEAIHNDNGEIKGENVFGAFFTMPYPRFRLQIKGFYGKPVTFQLACESVKGNFNSSTANFEVTASFIGYSYSLLTDIPIRYIFAAPDNPQYGQAYWEEHSNSSKWILSNGDKPLKMTEIYQRIKSANLPENIEAATLSEDDKTKIDHYNTISSSVQNLLNKYDDFINEFKKIKGTLFYNGNTGNNQMLLSSNSSIKKNIDGSYKNIYLDLCETIDDFKKKSDEYGFVDLIPTLDKTIFSKQLVYTESLSYSKDLASNKIYINLCSDGDEKITTEKFLNGDYAVNGVNVESGLANEILLTLRTDCRIEGLNEYGIENKDTRVLPYWCVINLGNLREALLECHNQCREKREYIEKNPSEAENINVRAILGFKPSIGNIMKIIMCHLETFCHILYSCARDVDSKHRTPRSTGINVNSTDFSNKDNVVYTPWPGYYDNGRTGNDSGEIDVAKTVYGWVGDIDNHPFIEEENVVKGFLSAVQKTYDDITKKDDIIILNSELGDGFSILPIDAFKENYNAFPKFSGATEPKTYLSLLSGWLGIRIAQIFGINENNGGNEKIANVMGVADAINFYQSLESKDALHKYIIQNSGESLKDNLINIMLCNDNAKTFGSSDGRQIFETNKICEEYSKTAMHPMYQKLDDSYRYVHFYDKTKNALVPTNLNTPTSYVGDGYFKYQSENKEGYFDITTSKFENLKLINNVLYRTNVKGLSTANIINENEYANLSLFTVIDESTFNMGEYYKKMKGKKTITGNGYTSPELEDLPLLVDRYAKYTQDEEYDRFFVDKGSHFFDVDKRKEKGDFKTFGDCYVKNFTNLFSHNFFVQQERISHEDTKLKCQALLFLNSIYYPKNAMKTLKNDLKCGIVEAVPYSYLCLVGGLLWRCSLNKDPFYYKKKGQKNNYVLRGSAYKKTFYFNFNGKYNSWNKLRYDGIYEDESTIIENNIQYSGTPLSIEEFLGTKLENIDYDVRNTLINCFTSFALKTFRDYKEKYGSKLNGNFINDGELTQYLLSIKDLKKDIVNDKEAQERFRELYTHKVYVRRVSPYSSNIETKNTRNEIIIKENIFEKYVKSFADTLMNIDKMNGNNTFVKNEENTTKDDANYTREMAIDTYNYLKNIWDKWLVTYHLDEQDHFNVENFFSKNFIFLDKFYNNIFDKLPINMNVVEQGVYDSFTTKDSTLFNYISNLISKHNCLFFALPDFINYGLSVDSGYKAMKEVFTAYPYSEIRAPESENKFVIIYSDKPAEVASTKGNKKRIDSFDIVNKNENMIPSEFKYIQLTDDNIVDVSLDNQRMQAYNVPAFSVSFGKQEQSIFKTVNVNMNNPMVTSVSCAAGEELSQLGSSTSRKLYWQGQDIFSIYSSYSYECEVEMMGNAQITPLMYFQLQNVPMWRGAYMIFKVQHSITPGNMVTRFTGQRMSRISTPWCREYVRKGKDATATDGTYPSTVDDGHFFGSEIYKGSTFPSKYDSVVSDEMIGLNCNDYEYGVKVGADYEKWLKENIINISGGKAKLTMDGKYALSCNAAKLYYKVKKEFENYTKNDHSIGISDALRNGGKNSKSDHEVRNGCNAMDLQITANDKLSTSSVKDYKDIFTVVDILVKNHWNETRQIIIEPYNPTYNKIFVDGSKRYVKNVRSNTYKTLHVAVKRNSKDTKNEIYLSNENDRYDTKPKMIFDSVNAAKLCAPEFLSIAKSMYRVLSYNSFVSSFRNFCGLSKEQLDELFKDVQGDGCEVNTYNTSDDASKYGVDDTRIFHEIVKYLGMPYDPVGVNPLVVRKNGYPEIDKNERAKLEEGSNGFNGCGLLWNVMKDLRSEITGTSCKGWYNVSNESNKNDKVAGDIIFKIDKNKLGVIDSDAKLFIYLGKDKIAYSDSNGGVKIGNFKELDGFEYVYRTFGKAKSSAAISSNGDFYDKIYKHIIYYESRNEYYIGYNDKAKTSVTSFTGMLFEYQKKNEEGKKLYDMLMKLKNQGLSDKEICNNEPLRQQHRVCAETNFFKQIDNGGIIKDDFIRAFLIDQLWSDEGNIKRYIKVFNDVTGSNFTELNKSFIDKCNSLTDLTKLRQELYNARVQHNSNKSKYYNGYMSRLNGLVDTFGSKCNISKA